MSVRSDGVLAFDTEICRYRRTRHRYLGGVRQSLARRAVIFLMAATAMATLAAAIPAQAASPQWQLAKVLRNCGDDSLSGITASGADNAWAIGQPSSGGATCGADVEHWNGRDWRRVAVPRGLDLLGNPDGFTLPVAASSGSDAWIFPGADAPLGLNLAAHDYALRWNGRAWLRSSFPARLIVTAAAAFSPAGAWAFGLVYRSADVTAPYAARFTGRTWHHVRLPGAVDALSVLSASDMWAVGPTVKTASLSPGRQVLIAMHWNGRSWHTVRLPRIKLASSPTLITAAASGPDDLWCAYLAPAKSRGAAGRISLLRWNGARWSGITVPASIRDSHGIEAMAQDGADGIWLLADVEIDYGQFEYWYHYGHGLWSRILVASPRGYSAQMFAMTWVPGTSQAWSAGEADANSGNSTVGVIARYTG